MSKSNKNVVIKRAAGWYVKRLLIPGIVVLTGVAVLIVSPWQKPAEPAEMPTPGPEAAATPMPAPTPSPAPTPEPAQTPEPTPAPEPTPGPGRLKVNPLTGESFNAAGEPWDEEQSTKRPVAVSIGNTGDAIPLWGIGEAEIICEYVVESVATRILAVYQEIYTVGRIGGIRSLRSSNMEIAQSFDAIFMHWIGRTYDNEVASGRPVTKFGTIDATHIGYRDPDKSGVNNAAVISGKRVIESLPKDFRRKHRKDFEQGFKFIKDGTPIGGTPVETVSVSFSNTTSKKTEFRYNSNDKKFYVQQYGRDLIDGNDNKRLSFKNVIIIQTDMVFNYNPSKHTYIRTTGEGTGYYVNGGKYAEITWWRPGLEAPYYYYTADGYPLKIGEGRSYICFVHNNETPVFN